ncbi:MAG: carbohydrate-binding protein [Blastochloris sp.]|nr:carbohydrate-binding protein [Blastochloris sp.]
MISGPTTPGWEGSYVLEDSIIIRGKVSRLIGLDATLNLKKGWPNDKPVFIFENGDAPAVVIQQMAFGLGQQMSSPTFVHRANRDLILSSFTGTNHLRHEGKGRLFAEDIVGNEWYVAPGSRVYARQMNLEGAEMKLVNDGGQIWILGLKTEARGPILETKNKGVTEVIGAHLYTCVKSGADRGAFFVQDATFSVVGAGEYAWTRDWATRELLHEVRGSETRTLSMDALKRRHMASMIPFLRSDLQLVPAGAAPTAPKAAVAETASNRISLKLEADPAIAASVVGMEIRKNNTTVAYVKPGLWQETGLAPETEHTYEVLAYDGFNRKSPPVTVTARTTGDTTPPTTPTDFRTERVIDLGATLAWKAAKDDIGVTGYEVLRLLDGKLEITEKLTALTLTDERVTPGAAYQYQVVALDAAGNRSLPALLDVTIPRDPPGEIIIKLAKADQRKKDNFSSKGWFAGDLHPTGWAIYENREMGRLKPFTKATLRYACDTGRGGAELEVILNPVVEKNDKGEPVMTGGTSLGRFTLAETGGWEKWQTVEMKTPIPTAGKHSIGLRVHKAASTESNALANVDSLTFNYE